MTTFGGAFLLLLAEAWVLQRIWPERARRSAPPGRPA